MIPLQIMSIIFALFMLYVARIHKKKRDIDSMEFLFWVILWIAFIYLVIFPQSFKGIIQTLRITRVFDLTVILALIVIIFFTFQNRISNKRIEKKVEEMVRKRTVNKTTSDVLKE